MNNSEIIRRDILSGMEVVIPCPDAELADVKSWLRNFIKIPMEIALGIKWSPKTNTATIKAMKFNKRDMQAIAEKNLGNQDETGLLSAMILQLLNDE